MKIAIFSDIHGNISGLKAVLGAIDKTGGVDVMIAAGDFVGGGPGTDDLLDLLQERQVRLVRGNAEEICLDMDAAWDQIYRLWQPMEPERDFDFERMKWMEDLRPTAEWLRNHLSQSNWDLLSELPLSLTVASAPGRRLLVCHATPNNPWPWVTGLNATQEELQEAYGKVDADVIAFGHVHYHHVRQFDSKLLINVASVQERDDMPGHCAFTRLHFAQNNWIVEQVLVPYDTVEENRLKSERQVPPRRK